MGLCARAAQCARAGRGGAGAAPTPRVGLSGAAGTRGLTSCGFPRNAGKPLPGSVLSNDTSPFPPLPQICWRRRPGQLWKGKPRDRGGREAYRKKGGRRCKSRSVRGGEGRPKAQGRGQCQERMPDEWCHRAVPACFRQPLSSALTPAAWGDAFRSASPMQSLRKATVQSHVIKARREEHVCSRGGVAEPALSRGERSPVTCVIWNRGRSRARSQSPLAPFLCMVQDAGSACQEGSLVGRPSAAVHFNHMHVLSRVIGPCLTREITVDLCVGLQQSAIAFSNDLLRKCSNIAPKKDDDDRQMQT